MNPGSALVVGWFCCVARGAATACAIGMPKSKRLRRIWRTVVMIVEPPGLPSANSGRP